ncbi:MAG TPA: SLC13/DASS family transporter [Candidatus Avilachnospira avistercoris]|nr:SLC13/DASS family transporter [Candidatus Avilachnospira avistercoris]
MVSPGIIGLIVLLLMVILFIWKPIPAPATGVLGCVLMVLFGVSSFEETFSGFSSSIVLLMASAMVVGIAMFKTGAAQIIGRMVIRLSHGNEMLFLMASCIVSGLLSMFLANTAILAAFISIVDSVCRTSPKIKQRNIVLPLACSVMFGGASTLIGCTPQLTANGLMSEMVGIEMGMWDLTGPGLSLFAIFLLYLYFIGYKHGKSIWSGRKSVEMVDDEEKLRSVIEAHYDKRQVRLMLLITAVMIVSYITSVIPPALTALIAALLCVVLGLCSVGDIERELDWKTVVFLASCLGLANALTVSGAGELIGDAVAGLLGDVRSPMVIFAVLVMLTLFISQFITNSTAIIITLPIGLSLCTMYGFSHMAFCIGITLAASIACCTPLAAAQITMTQVAGYEFSDYLRYCLPLTLICYVAILIVVPLFFPLV